MLNKGNIAGCGLVAVMTVATLFQTEIPQKVIQKVNVLAKVAMRGSTVFVRVQHQLQVHQIQSLTELKFYFCQVGHALKAQTFL